MNIGDSVFIADIVYITNAFVVVVIDVVTTPTVVIIT